MGGDIASVQGEPLTDDDGIARAGAGAQPWYTIKAPSIMYQKTACSFYVTIMWANAQRDDRPAEYRWRPLFNAAKFG